MKLLSNNLAAEWERWEDPGDYPSAAGSGPLPSYDYVESISGEIRLELTAEDAANCVGLTAGSGDFNAFVATIDKDLLELPSGVDSVSKWRGELDGLTLILTVHEDAEIAGGRDRGDDEPPWIDEPGSPY
jgi:hypothetical protein